MAHHRGYPADRGWLRAGPVGRGGGLGPQQGFVYTEVGKILQSQAFADAWIQANRVAHDALVKTLTGQGGEAVTVEGDTVSVNLAPFIQTVKQRLVASGFGLANRIPQVNASFVLFHSEQITRARSAFNLLNTLGIWLPIIAIVLLGVGAYVATDHRRALVGAAVGVAVAMLGLALSLAVFRTIYLDTLPPEVLPHDAAAVLYDNANKQLLRIAAVTLAGLALVFWGQPTGKTILLLAGLLLVALALIEFLGQPSQRTIVTPRTKT